MQSSVTQSTNQIPILRDDGSDQTFYDLQDYIKNMCPDDGIAQDL